jgi:hypothetical protein
MADLGTSGSGAVTMAVFAALTYDIISATNSSPQTTEINAGTRAPTLMKWVKLGLAQAAVFALLGAAMEARAGRSAAPVILGAGSAGVLLWAQYIHAKNAGTSSPGASTEQTSGYWNNPG